jgi:hypothetical protein
MPTAFPAASCGGICFRMMASGIDPWQGYWQTSLRSQHIANPKSPGLGRAIRRTAVVVIAFGPVGMSGDF